MIETISVPRRAFRRTRMEIAAAAERQAEVVAVLQALGKDDVVARFERCMAARLIRRGDPAAAQTWGFRCGSAGCSFCGRTHQNRAWRSCLRWGWGVAQRSLAVIPLPHKPGGLRDAVRAMRRSIRDLRDYEAHKSRRWHEVGFGGVVVGDAMWLVLLHNRLDRQGIERVLRRRWPAARVSAVLSSPLPFSAATSDLVELALARRGGEEPFKVVVGLREGHSLRRDDENQEDCLAAMPVVV